MGVCVCVCSAVFYSAVDNMSSPSPQSESGKPCWCVCVCVFVCVCALYASTLRQWEVYVCGERKGWRLFYVCASVFLSFPPLANAYF